MEQLKENRLPTKTDVLQSIILLKSEKFKINLKSIFVSTANSIEKIWQKTCIPIITTKRIIVKIEDLYSSYESVLKFGSATKFTIKIAEFKKKCDETLFEISKCKCDDIFLCKCPWEAKVPLKEKNFLLDQRTERKMVFGNVDKKMTENFERKLKNQSKIIKKRKIESVIASSSTSTSTSTETQIVHQKENPNFPPKRIKLTNVAAILNSSDVSYRVGASICNAFLKDMGITSEEDIIDPSKVFRAKKEVRETATFYHLNALRSFIESQQAIGLFFDGKIDKTFNTIVNEETERSHPRFNKENHYVMLFEPGNNFYTHITPNGKQAVDLAKCIYDKMELDFINKDKIEFIGCDGTIFNTGHLNGVICEFEKMLMRPVHWIICLLHFNELPLKKLFAYCDGPTAGPRNFSGTIGQELEHCEDMAVKIFEKIKTEDMPELPQNIFRDLSSDQKYLYQIINAVRKGKCEQTLANCKPGPLNHARFLTLSNRILRLYISKEKPSLTLTFLATFVVQVYGPMWFISKWKNELYEGPKIFFKYIQLIKWLPPTPKNLVRKIIEFNSYFAHCENILLSMLVDSQREVRKMAVDAILKIRSENSESMTQVRTFEKPTNINYEASHYYEMINLQSTKTTEPPVSKCFSNDQLLTCIESDDNIIKQKIVGLPTNSQAVERAVKLVSYASNSVSGEEKRNGNIYTKIALKKILPSTNSKKDYTGFMKLNLFE